MIRELVWPEQQEAGRVAVVGKRGMSSGSGFPSFSYLFFDGGLAWRLRPNLDHKPMMLNISGTRKGMVAWREIFGNDHPVELEIGAGEEGHFCWGLPRRKPERNFVGIEYAKGVMRDLQGIG